MFILGGYALHMQFDVACQHGRECACKSYIVLFTHSADHSPGQLATARHGCLDMVGIVTNITHDNTGQ